MDAGLTVVKLGGSLAFSDALRPWLDALSQCARHVVVVPGGGPFADAVRAAQPRMGFDDRAAHHMALSAMEQYGRALVGLGRTNEAIVLLGRAQGTVIDSTGLRTALQQLTTTGTLQ